MNTCFDAPPVLLLDCFIWICILIHTTLRKTKPPIGKARIKTDKQYCRMDMSSDKSCAFIILNRGAASAQRRAQTLDSPLDLPGLKQVSLGYHCVLSRGRFELLVWFILWSSSSLLLSNFLGSAAYFVKSLLFGTKLPVSAQICC